MTLKKRRRLKKVLLIHTGGTFGMQKGAPHLALSRSSEYLGTLFKRVPELEEIAEIDLEILCNVDSSDISPVVWKRLAEAIVSKWHDYDGFVIIHGTDTMAYTASALSFFLEGVSKPIVLTGSQRALSEIRTDARANIIDSVELATLGFGGVMICFDSKVHRGTRASKYSNEHLQAFRSYNSQPLGAFGVHFIYNKKLLPRVASTTRTNPKCDTRIDTNIACIDCVPGVALSAALQRAILETAHAVVLRGFGAGNLPLADASFENLCKKARDKKIPVVMATQCPSGRISLTAYANGRRFRELGVVSGLDMSFEALTVKLMVMLGRKIKFERRHAFFSTPLAFECRPEDEEHLK